MSLILLKRACEHHKSQRKVATKLEVSATTVNQILKGIYPKPEKILQKISEVFADLEFDEVVCPTLGEIHINVCTKYQEMAKKGKVHRDRLYMQVKDKCLTCQRSE